MDQVGARRVNGRFDTGPLEEWAAVLADDRRRGLVSRLARVLSARLTDDETMSCHVALPIIGRDQEIRILHRREHPVPELLDHDYWVIEPADGPTEIVRMIYSDGGMLRG